MTKDSISINYPHQIILFKNPWLINLSVLRWGLNRGGGGSGFHNHLLAITGCEQREFLLKIQEITRLHFLPHFLTLPDLREKSEVSMAIGKAWVPGNRNVLGLMTNPGEGRSCHWLRCFVCGGLPKGIRQQWLKELSRPLSVPHTNETLRSRTGETPPLQNATLFNSRFNPNQGKVSFPPWNCVLHHGEVT